MLWKKRNRKRSASTNAMMNWIIMGMVIYAIIIHFSRDNAEITIKTPQEAKQFAGETIATIKNIKNKILPVNLSLQEIKQGNGAPAICGQTVKITYKTFDSNSKPLEDSAAKDTPLAFTIGEKKVMPAFDEGISGMRIGGIRRITAPPIFAYGAKGFGHKDMPTNDIIIFEVEMLETSPEVPDAVQTSFRFIDTRNSSGKAVTCGNPSRFNITAWDIDGKKLYTNTSKDPSPLTLTPGSGEHFLGLENSILGMKTGSTRTAIIPPVFQKRLNGKKEPLEIPFPKNQTILVDIEAVP